jgi:hypothetical protein
MSTIPLGKQFAKKRSRRSCSTHCCTRAVTPETTRDPPSAVAAATRGVTNRASGSEMTSADRLGAAPRIIAASRPLFETGPSSNHVHGPAPHSACRRAARSSAGRVSRLAGGRVRILEKGRRRDDDLVVRMDADLHTAWMPLYWDWTPAVGGAAGDRPCCSSWVYGSPK